MKTTSLAEKRREIADQLPKALSDRQIAERARTRIRHNLARLAHDKFNDVETWLDLVAEIDGPKAALDVYLKLLEFAVPKLTRAEVKVDKVDTEGVANLTIDDLQQLIREGVELEARTINGSADDITAGRGVRATEAETVSEQSS